MFILQLVNVSAVTLKGSGMEVKKICRKLLRPLLSLCSTWTPVFKSSPLLFLLLHFCFSPLSSIRVACYELKAQPLFRLHGSLVITQQLF